MTHPKVFAFGLVRYAMKYYGKKTFWPYFETEFGIIVLLADDKYDCIADVWAEETDTGERKQ